MCLPFRSRCTAIYKEPRGISTQRKHSGFPDMKHGHEDTLVNLTADVLVFTETLSCTVRQLVPPE